MPARTPIDDCLTALPKLRRILEAEDTGMAVVCADGTWHVEKYDGVHLQEQALPQDPAAHLVQAVQAHGPACCLKRWWIHSLSGPPRPSVILDRRPKADPAGLSPHTVELLRSRIKPGSNGLVFGNSRAARSGLLLTLSRFLPGDLIVYVGSVPPLPPRGVELIHVMPPRHDRDRHELAQLFDRASAVLFDGSVWRADIRVLFTGHTVQNRWLAVDAESPEDWAASFVLPPRLKTPLNVHIGVDSTSVQTIRLQYLALRKKGDWRVLFEKGEVRESGLSEAVSHPGDPVRLSSQVTSPIDHRRDDGGLGTPDSEPAPDAAATPVGLAATSSSASIADDDEFDVEALMEDDDEPMTDDRESGEIDVPGFVSERQKQLQRARATDEDTNPSPVEVLRGERIDDELPGLIASSDIDEVEIPDIAPEQLRQTYVGPVDAESLRKERRLQREEAGREDSSPDDADSVPRAPSGEEKPVDTKPVEVSPHDEDIESKATTRIKAGPDGSIPGVDGRTITVNPQDKDDDTEATTAELGAFSKTEVVHGSDVDEQLDEE